MTTVEGLFGAGDTVGGSAHKFSSGSFTEGRLAGKSAVKYVMDLKGGAPQVGEAQINKLKELIFRPLENHRVGRNQIVAGTVAPSYINPLQGLQRLGKLMDEYVGGVSTFYVTNEPLLNRGLELLLAMLKEDIEHLGGEPAPTPAGMGAPAQGLDRGGGDQAHAVQAGDPVAGLLLSRRSSEAGRRRVACFHRISVRREDG
jgi:hypothetical protein